MIFFQKKTNRKSAKIYFKMHALYELDADQGLNE